PTALQDFLGPQRRSKRAKARDVEREPGKTPVYLLVFDVLNVDGKSLLRPPYEQRRERLFDTVSESDHIYVPVAFDGTLDEAMDAGRELKLEGVMAKQKDSIYQIGRAHV